MTAIEACSCPMFCQCYFNTEPAAHHHHGHGDAEHYCRFNIAWQVNHGHHGGTDLTGARFWMAGDLGSGWEDGRMDWSVLHFDPGVSREQREGILEIVRPLFPVEWASFEIGEELPIEWRTEEDREEEFCQVLVVADLGPGLGIPDPALLDRPHDASTDVRPEHRRRPPEGRHLLSDPQLEDRVLRRRTRNLEHRPQFIDRPDKYPLRRGSRPPSGNIDDALIDMPARSASPIGGG